MKKFTFFETEADALKFVIQRRLRKYELTQWSSEDKIEKMKFVLFY